MWNALRSDNNNHNHNHDNNHNNNNNRNHNNNNNHSYSNHNNDKVQTTGAKWEPFITRFPTDSSDPLKAATQVPIVGQTVIFCIHQIKMEQQQ
ncbi:unnamed protein product [Polarella glacialis]|uniref:Uncharacterized protein n=1 Tax=Polarella glacialis TaxID=89957 RepID=A0A813KPS1_POLGL|nr:unnamed protein product [Polarella glacialis]